MKVDDRLAEIFTRQLSYYNSLQTVIENNGLIFWNYPLLWDDREEQEHLRILAWRLTEELIEALNSNTNLLEELADALHFLVEISLAAGVSQAELFTGVEYSALDVIGDQDCLSIAFQSETEELFAPTHLLSYRIYRTIDILGQTMNTLRQRPWRKEHRPSERKHFVAGLNLVFKSFIDACALKFGADDLYRAYFAKSKINDARQAGTSA